MNPYKQFPCENIDIRWFRASMHPEIKIFGKHVKFPEKKKLNIHEKRSKTRFCGFGAYIYEDKHFFSKAKFSIVFLKIILGWTYV